jgi:hypothetical protein
MIFSRWPFIGDNVAHFRRREIPGITARVSSVFQRWPRHLTINIMQKSS